MDIKKLSCGVVSLIRAKYLLPVSDTFGRDARIEDGYVMYQDNEILEVGPYTDEIGRAIMDRYGSDLNIIGSYNNSEIPCHGGVLLPGFVKGHGHDHESPIIGVAKDVPLTTWLDEAVNIFTGFLLENKEELTDMFGVSPYLLTYLKAKIDDISYGITSGMTHHCNFNKYSVEELVEAVNIVGMSCMIAVGSQDRNYDPRILDVPPSIAFERMDKYYELFKDEAHVSVLPGPDQFFSNGPELLQGLKSWADEHNTFLHIHSSEEPATTAWFTEEYGMTPIEYASSIGVLDENTIVAHQVNCTDNDLLLLQETGTKCVHNPLANTILGSGMPPVMKWIEMGIPVAISTDGSGSADHQNILNAARVASQFQKAYHQDAHVLPAQKCLEMITIDPANILGLNKGSLDVGKDADIILIDLDHLNLTPSLKENVVENLIWASNGNEVQYVVANGNLVVDDYQIKCVDVELVKSSIRKLSEKFFEYKKTAQKITGTGVHNEDD